MRRAISPGCCGRPKLSNMSDTQGSLAALAALTPLTRPSPSLALAIVGATRLSDRHNSARFHTRPTLSAQQSCSMRSLSVYSRKLSSHRSS